ncbi:GNAT family N-acetyltransferase [Paenibacillus sp. D51F]
MSNPIELRGAMPADASSLAELLLELTGTDTDPAALAERLDNMAGNDGIRVAVASDGERLVGTAMGILCPDLVGGLRPYLLIENVVVSAHCRGGGVGKKLMADLERFANAHQCTYMILVSGAHRSEAHAFYESVGFTREAGFKKKLRPLA